MTIELRSGKVLGVEKKGMMLRSGKVLWVENTENKSERKTKTSLINEVDKSARKSVMEKEIEKDLVFTDKIVTSDSFNKEMFVERSSKYLSECNLKTSVYEKSSTMLQFMNYILMNLPERRLWKEYRVDNLARVFIIKIDEYMSYSDFNLCVSDNNVDIKKWKELFNEISKVE